MFDRLIKLRGSIRVLLTISVALFLISENSFQVHCETQFNETNSPQPSSQTSENLPDGLIFAEENRINAVDRKGEKVIQLATSTAPTSPIFDCKRKTLYWIDNFTKIKAFKLFEQQSNISLLFDDDASVLRSLALDSINDKLYIGNAAFHTIEVIDLKTGIRGIIRSQNLSAINSIAIDSNEGYLFVLGEKELIRMDLDGSNARTILEALPEETLTRVATGTIWGGYDMVRVARFLSINSISLNTEEKKLYWVKDVNGTISSSTYDGKDKKFRARYKLNKADKTTRPFGSPLAFLSDVPYWIDHSQGTIKRINWSNGSDSTIIYKGIPKKLSSISPINCSSIDHSQRTNPCEKENGGCQHLCILSRNSTNNYRCFCKVDYQLAEDGKSCILPTSFIAFTQKKPNNRSDHETYLRGIAWREDTKQFIDVLDPSKRAAGDLSRLEVNTKDRMIFYQSGVNLDDYEKNILHGVNLNDEKKFKLQPDFRATNTHEIAFDWVTKNLYYFSFYYAVDTTLNVLNTKNPTYSKILTRHSNVRSGLAVHPNKGYVFFVETRPTKWYPPTSKVHRIHTDGSNGTLVLEQREQISYIAIDFSDDKLYWNEMPLRQDDQENKLFYSDLDGGSITRITARLYQPSVMVIQGDWIYVINNNRESLDRVFKKGGKTEQLMKSEIFGLRIFDSSIQVTKSDHPCANDNHCEKFCFAVPKTNKTESLMRVCGCPYGEKLAADGKSCIDNSKEEPPFETCPPIATRCIYPANYEFPTQ